VKTVTAGTARIMQRQTMRSVISLRAVAQNATGAGLTLMAMDSPVVGIRHRLNRREANHA
jgi:hypothetical protein